MHARHCVENASILNGCFHQILPSGSGLSAEEKEERLEESELTEDSGNLPDTAGLTVTSTNSQRLVSHNEPPWVQARQGPRVKRRKRTWTATLRQEALWDFYFLAKEKKYPSPVASL